MVKYGFFMNSFFAISLDVYNKKEHIIYCVGYADEFFNERGKNICRENRGLGEFVFDFASGIENFITKDRYNVLYEYLVEYKNFVEVNAHIWKYDDELTVKYNALIDLIDYLKTPMLSECFFDAQKHLSLNERHQYSSFEILKQCYPERIADVSNDFRVFYIGNIPYIATDFRFIELFRCYLDEIYAAGMFPRSCMSCGSLFLSGKKHGDVLCSSECRKKKKSQNTMSYYERLSENETLYNSLYRKWKQRIDRAEENHTIGSDGISQLRLELKDLTEINRVRANERKKGNVPEKNGIPDYESFDQRYYEDLMSKDQFLYQLFNSVKAD